VRQIAVSFFSGRTGITIVSPTATRTPLVRNDAPFAKTRSACDLAGSTMAADADERRVTLESLGIGERPKLP